MRQPVPVLLIALFALTSLSARADDWKKDFTTSAKPALHVDTNDADIRVTAWERKETEARVITDGYKIGPSDVRVTDRQSGDRIDLEVHVPRFFGLVLGSHSVHIEIQVPRQGDLDLHSGDGGIRVQSVKGDVRLDSADGDLEVHDADGKLTANTRDGNIRAQGRFDALDLHTADGNIDAEVASGSKMASGWSLRTGDGNVALRLPQDLAANLDAHAGDGHMSIDFPVSVNGSLQENTVRGKINGGGPLLLIRTGDGDIRLEKS